MPSFENFGLGWGAHTFLCRAPTLLFTTWNLYHERFYLPNILSAFTFYLVFIYFIDFLLSDSVTCIHLFNFYLGKSKTQMPIEIAS